MRSGLTEDHRKMVSVRGTGQHKTRVMGQGHWVQGHPRRLVPLLLLGEELVSPALMGAQVHEDMPLEEAGRSS